MVEELYLIMTSYFNELLYKLKDVKTFKRQSPQIKGIWLSDIESVKVECSILSSINYQNGDTILVEKIATWDLMRTLFKLVHAAKEDKQYNKGEL